MKRLAVVIAILLLGACGPDKPAPTPTISPTPEPTVAETTVTPDEEVIYQSCAAVRAAGIKTPLHRGDKAYNPHLDRDNDGVACE